MGRQKFNKRNHILRANSLHESRDLTNKGLLTEQQNPNCPSVYYNGQAGTQNYWQANYITQGQLNFCSFWNANTNSTPGVGQGGPGGTMTGADLFADCGCSLSGNTGPTCYGCVGGSMVTNDVWPNTMTTQMGYWANGYYTTPPSSQQIEFCIMQGNSWGDNGLNTGYGMTQYQATVDLGWHPTLPPPQGTMSINEYWFTDQALVQAMCTSGGTQTNATCMNVKTVQCNNPSSGGEWPCATIDGVVPDQTYVGKVIDAGASDPNGPIYFEITEITPSGSSPWGTQDFPEIQTGCPPVNNANSTTSCTIAWNTPCADTELNTGGENSWTTFLGLRQTGWDSVGCQHLQNVVNWNTNQLNSGVNASGAQLNNVQISRKTEQIAWAQCQANECGCPSLNVPPLTGGPTPPPPSTGGPTPPPPSAPPNPLAGTGGIKPEKKKGEINKKDKKKLNEEFTKMRTLWRYNK